MSRRAKAVDLDKLFEASVRGKPKRNASVCGTCSKEQASASKITQYVELVRAGLEVRGVSHLHKFITAYTGYTHSITSLRRHLVDCLGLTPGD